MSVQIEHLPNGFIRARDRASGLEALFYRNGEVRGGNGSIPAFVNTRATLMLREADRLDRLNAGHPSPLPRGPIHDTGRNPVTPYSERNFPT